MTPFEKNGGSCRPIRTRAVPGFAEATKCIALVCADTLAFLFSSGQTFPISDKKGVVLATLLLECAILIRPVPEHFGRMWEV
jgi:hypothetical protein